MVFAVVTSFPNVIGGINGVLGKLTAVDGDACRLRHVVIVAIERRIEVLLRRVKTSNRRCTNLNMITHKIVTRTSNARMPAAGKPRFCIQRCVVVSNDDEKHDFNGFSRTHL
jgi:hypothetical protein